MSYKWENFSENQIKNFIQISESYAEIGRKMGYKNFRKAQIQKILDKYPDLACEIEKMTRKKDLVGKRFGRLTVLYFDEEYSRKKKDSRFYWKCQCDCGKLTHVSTSSLKNGNTKSCGCLHSEASKNITFIDMTGEKYGSLTVIKQGTHPDGVSNTRAYWWCQCDCGNPNLILVSGQLLRNGHKTSCGCIISQYEKQIQRILNDNKIEYKQQYSFPDLVSDNKRVLRFDFAIFKNKELAYLIEFQGQQHYKSVPGWGGEEKFQLQKKYDQKKINYCENNNIPLVILTYKDKIDCNNVVLKEFLEGNDE